MYYRSLRDALEDMVAVYIKDILAAPRALHGFGLCHTQSCAGNIETENKTKHNQTTFTTQNIRTVTKPLASLRVR